MRYSLHDGPGIRTTVFLKGCPLDCWWCHNPECQKATRELSWFPSRCRLCQQCVDHCPQEALILRGQTIERDTTLCSECGTCVDTCLSEAWSLVGRSMSPEEVLQEVLKDLIFYEESGGGVTFSGGEPLLQPEFLASALKLCHDEAIHRAVDTSGYAPACVLKKIAPLADLFLFDVKFVDDQQHQRFTGVSNEPILANLKWLVEGGWPVMVSIPIIPGINDDESQVKQLGRFLASMTKPVRVRLLPYHATGKSKYLRLGRTYRLNETETPRPAHLTACGEQLAAYGIETQVGDDFITPEQEAKSRE